MSVTFQHLLMVTVFASAATAAACTSWVITPGVSKSGNMIVQKCRDSERRRLEADIRTSPRGWRWMRIGALDHAALFGMNEHGVVAIMNDGDDLILAIGTPAAQAVAGTTSEIPIIGEAVFDQAILVYIALIAVPVLWFILMKTSLGLKIRSVGENPQACDTVGINVYRVRYGTILFSGALAGLAGAYVSMGQLNSFTEDMIAGRGFIALAAVVLGNYMPGGVLAATLIFGAASALQYRMQATAISVPYQFWLMLPYVITIIAICLYRKSSNQAASTGKPYNKQ